MQDNWRQKAIRVTKYDPKLRNAEGVYLGDEWTSYSDVGNLFNGKELTNEEYETVERKYVESIKLFFSAVFCDHVIVSSLEKYQYSDVNVDLLDVFGKIGDEKSYSLVAIDEIAKLNLRGYLWCELKGAGKTDYVVKFGYDYYMYFVGPDIPFFLTEGITRLGLFVD